MRTIMFRHRGWVGGTVLIAVLMAWLAPTAWATLRSQFTPRSLVEDLPTSPVRRVDLSVTVRTGGTIESSKKTIIECELERVRLAVRGRVLSGGGNTTILSLAPEGTMVRQGDLLCQLDASEYEEFVRQEHLSVEMARADKVQAELRVQAAEIALLEYREGIATQLRQDYSGEIALLESEYARAEDRLLWSQRMLHKGYVPASQVTADRMALEQARLKLEQVRLRLKTFDKYTRPMMIARFEGNLEIDKAALISYTRRLQIHEERLANFQRQVELCSIRAPHDGFLIYARPTNNRHEQIEEGTQVRQKQPLFYLPDLSEMEVETLLHESIVDQVREGMPARVRVEAFPDQVLEGQVVAVASLPMIDTNWRSSREVKNYVGRVKLDTAPEGLRPGLSAEVEILTDRRPEALVVPPEAVAIEEGQEYCYVTHGRTLQRRAVTVAQTTSEWLEVIEGLEEGERVVLDPTRAEGVTTELAGSPSSPTL